MLEETAKKILENEKIITISETDSIYFYQDGIYVPAETEIKKRIQMIMGDRCRNRHVMEIINLIKRKTYISLTKIDEEKNPIIIPCRDCIFSFETLATDNNLNLTFGERSHSSFSPVFIFFKKHPIYSPRYIKEHAPEKLDLSNNKINNYVSSLFDNYEDEILVKEILGYCFYRALPFQNFFLFVGSGANGKSTLLNVFERAIGFEFIANETLQSLTDNRFAVAELYDKNVNISADLPSTSLKHSGYLKQLTGGDFIYAEKKFKEPFKFKNFAKLIFSCNQIPDVNDESDAIYRRAVIVPFTKSFVENPNRNIVNELCADELELSAFVWGCVVAFKEALNSGSFIRSHSLAETKKMFRSFSNNVAVFCDEYLDFDPEVEQPSELVYMVYKNFCLANKLPIKDERSFGRYLFREFGDKIYKKRKWGHGLTRYYVYVGIDFKRQYHLTPEQQSHMDKILGDAVESEMQKRGVSHD